MFPHHDVELYWSIRNAVYDDLKSKLDFSGVTDLASEVLRQDIKRVATHLCQQTPSKLEPRLLIHIAEETTEQILKEVRPQAH